MTALTKDPMLRREAWCQCSKCKEYFTSATSFDYHRVTRVCGMRSCLTPQELSEAMVRVGSGHWRAKCVIQRASGGTTDEWRTTFNKERL